MHKFPWPALVVLVLAACAAPQRGPAPPPATPPVVDALTGQIALGEPLTKTSFELSLPLESLFVDDEASRQSAGGIFAAPVPEKDREATRANMLGPKVLDAATQSAIRLTSESITGDAGQFEARVRVSLAGHESVVGLGGRLARNSATVSARAIVSALRA